MTLSGYNLNIVDGVGSTARNSGLGNLTIGYNRLGNSVGDVRTGSHNLILGDRNNYSGYGGLVAGYDNTISGAYATVTGGTTNTASGQSSSVSGGEYNTASGRYAFVSGGVNTASGDYASVSGGSSLTQNNGDGWTGGNYHTP